ncbi:unnamed protein product [Medioppia subpectinata]|uniref:Kinesin motor domain-containing protein n=1 Tax=Medioppia subpectinata TaxID=1979941 RepID=A0A7R9Q4A9_9ACAR|nr:unnamed protein product [Medioppia subpectinata]CAG2111423.1 unnamed protein product [Medioppia subpectinata]
MPVSVQRLTTRRRSRSADPGARRTRGAAAVSARSLSRRRPDNTRAANAMDVYEAQQWCQTLATVYPSPVPSGQLPRLWLAVRKRPLNGAESARKCCDVVSVLNGRSVLVDNWHLTGYPTHHFRFDHAFDERADTGRVYAHTVRPLIETLFAGEMATCLAYGVTGAGKTHTMGGHFRANGDQMAGDGVYALAAADVLSRLRAPEYRTKNMNAMDLLNYNTKLRVVADSGRPVQVIGLRECCVYSVEKVLYYVKMGTKLRNCCSTSANRQSSRSHAIFQIKLSEDGIALTGRLSLVDLAGVERGGAYDTGYQYNRQTIAETADINKSLKDLNECIRELGRPDVQRLASRGHTLTRVLRDSFTGNNSRICMIAMISPTMQSCEHTLNTLRYVDGLIGLRADSSSPVPVNGTDENIESNCFICVYSENPLLPDSRRAPVPTQHLWTPVYSRVFKRQHIKKDATGFFSYFYNPSVPTRRGRPPTLIPDWLFPDIPVSVNSRSNLPVYRALRNNMAANTPKLDRYSGDGKMSPEDWFNVFDIVLLSANIVDDKDKVTKLISYLSGDAFVYYGKLVAGRLATITWAEVRAAYIKKFASPAPAPLLQASKMQKCNQTIEEYFKAMTKLLDKTSATDEERIDMLTNGLPDSYQDRLIGKDIDTPDKWLTICTKFEYKFNAKAGPKPSTSGHTSGSQSKHQHSAHCTVDHCPDVKRNKQTERKQFDTSKACPYDCRHCKAKGISIKHWHRECPNRPSTPPSERRADQQNSTHLSLMSDNNVLNPEDTLITIPAAINGDKTVVICDSASTSNLVSDSFVRTDGLQTHSIPSTDIRQVCGVARTDRAATFELTINGITKTVNAKIIKGFPYCCLIGIQTCGAFKIHIDMENRTATVGRPALPRKEEQTQTTSLPISIIKPPEKPCCHIPGINSISGFVTDTDN